MWVCKNCNEVNQNDDLAFCRICDADRNAVVEVKRPESGWACASCGKRNPVKFRHCPVCSAPRYSGDIGQAARDARPAARRPEAFVRLAADKIEAIGLGRLCGGVLAAFLVLSAALFALNRGPSREAVKRHFEGTELARINSGFAGRTLAGPDRAQDEALRELEALSGTLERLARETGGRMPSAAFLELARKGVNPEPFRKELIRVGRAVDRYTAGRIGPIGAGYALKEIRVVRSEKRRVDGEKRCLVEYEAELSALDDVVRYRPPYLAGQEHGPLVVNGDVRWDGWDRFYQAWLARNSEAAKAAAADFERNRGIREHSRGATRLVNGSMAFVKTGHGWEPLGGATR